MQIVHHRNHKLAFATLLKKAQLAMPIENKNEVSYESWIYRCGKRGGQPHDGGCLPQGPL
jgi:hypothetical protein